MTITVQDDIEEVIVQEGEIVAATISDTEVNISSNEQVLAIPSNDIELVVTSDDPSLTLQYDDVEIVVQSVADSVVRDLYLLSQESIITALPDGSLPGSKIDTLPADKLTDGSMSAKVGIPGLISTSPTSFTINYSESDLTLGTHRVNMGEEQDRSGLPTFLLRHTNGYDSDHPSYISNFGIQSDGSVNVRGIIDVLPGSSGISNLSDAGILATRDTTTFYSDTIPTTAIEGDIWYDTTSGANIPARFNGTSWDSVQDADIAIAQGSIDGKIRTYWQGTAPTGLTAVDDGDLWFDTANGNKVYFYDDTAVGEPIPKWRDAQDSAIASATLDAATAQATADGKVTTYTGTSFPVYVDADNTGTEGIGDLFYKTDTKVTYRALVYPVGLIYNPAEWEVVGNAFDETGLLTDTANLGGTADWSGVNNDNGLAPEDNADVTNIGGSNYVVRGLSSPNSTSGSIGTVSIGAGEWGFQLPDSSSASQIMTFDLPSLSTTLSYVLGFWAYSSVGAAEVIISIPNTPVQHTLVLTTTPTYYSFDMTSNDVDMANAVLQFTKTTTIAGATSVSTIYDVMFEQGVQPTDWVPFNPAMDGADHTKSAFEIAGGLEITSGGLTMNAGGAVKSTGITSEYTAGIAGYWLGYNTVSSNYTFGIGDGNEGYIKYDGNELRLGRDVQLSGADAYENSSIYWHSYFESLDCIHVVGPVTVGYYGIQIPIGATAASAIRRIEGGLVDTSWDKGRRWKVVLDVNNPQSLVSDVTVMLGEDTTGLGFVYRYNPTTGKMDVYGFNTTIQGRTETLLTDINAPTLSASSAKLEVVLTPGVKADYYVNNVFYESITTFLPVGLQRAESFFSLTTEVDTNAFSSARVSEIAVLQES